MELFEVSLTDDERRNRATFVRERVLPGAVVVPGQRVVLRDQDGEYFAGSVVDCLEAEGGRSFLVQVGVRLPEEHALRRLGRVPEPRRSADDEMDSLLDLLGSARSSLDGAFPSQRGLDPN